VYTSILHKHIPQSGTSHYYVYADILTVIKAYVHDDVYFKPLPVYSVLLCLTYQVSYYIILVNVIIHYANDYHTITLRFSRKQYNRSSDLRYVYTRIQHDLPRLSVPNDFEYQCDIMINTKYNNNLFIGHLFF
jgi:hypothetical protein